MISEKPRLKWIVTILTVFIALTTFERYSPSVSASTVNLPQTGQKSCWDISSKSIACSGTGQDGDIQAGVAWPSPRFTDNGDQTMTDNLTGLIWTKDAGIPTVGSCTGGVMTWTNALDYVACLNTVNYLGHTDWRLPNINELESLVNAEQSNVGQWLVTQGYINVQLRIYWSSTTSVLGASCASCAWVVGMRDGYVDVIDKSSPYYVWPVRTGPGSFGNSIIWATGQTKSYHSGDDGDIKAGAVWPSPRFIDNNDGTVTDNLTGLTWTKNANLSGVRTWQQALDYVASMNAGTVTNNGHTDWRLPNRKELRSQADYSKLNPALPAGNPYNVLSDYFWSSTTSALTTDCAWFVNVWSGRVYYGSKSDTNNFVWPVRAGQVSNLVNADKAIIVAGSGPYTGSTLWNDTQNAANYAWRMLNYQGFTKNAIYYLSFGHNLECDDKGNNCYDTVNATPSNANLQNAITKWAQGSNNVIIYITGHGRDGEFQMNGNSGEYLNASDLATWLNTLQSTITGKIIFVYDACYSGSFIKPLAPPSGKTRINITSTSPTEQAVFAAGDVSFSSFFWQNVSNGANLYDAFTSAKNSANYANSKQNAVIDADGDGTGNEKNDVSIAQSVVIGRGSHYAGDLPIINSVSQPQTLNGGTTAIISASVTANGSIQRVWAIVTPPDFTPPSGQEITNQPFFELTSFDGKSFKGSYHNFTVNGTYNITILALDDKKTISIPKTTTVTQSSTSTPPHHPVRDFDGDGKLDILLQNTSGAIAVWLMNVTTIKSGGYVSTSLGTGWQVAGVGDFDGDGISDILLRNSTTGVVVVWFMQGTTIKSGGYVSTSLDSTWQVAGTGDFNGDGKSDVLLYNSTTGAVVVWLLNGSAIIGGGYVTALDSSWQIKGVGDLDGDGMSDIILQNSSGAVCAWLMNGSSIIGGGYVSASLPATWQVKGVGDFNGDGFADILLRNSTTGAIYVWLMQGTASNANTSGYVTSTLTGWNIAEVGDFDGDGKSDILLQNSTSGAVVVWLLNGTSITGGGYVTTALDAGWQIK